MACRPVPDDDARGKRLGRGRRGASRQVPGCRGFTERTRERAWPGCVSSEFDYMGAGNNRLFYLPARIARFEFIFLIEFKLSSTCRAGAPVRGPLGYARCPARPKALPGRPRRCVASRPVPPRIVLFSSDLVVYQRIYRTKDLLSRLTEGPFPRFSEFRCAGGLLAIGGRNDTEWYEF